MCVCVCNVCEFMCVCVHVCLYTRVLSFVYVSECE